VGGLDGFAPVLGLADDVDAAGGEQGVQAGADEFLVVGEYDAGHSVSRRGIVAVSR